MPPQSQPRKGILPISQCTAMREHTYYVHIMPNNSGTFYIGNDEQHYRPVAPLNPCAQPLTRVPCSSRTLRRACPEVNAEERERR